MATQSHFPKWLPKTILWLAFSEQNAIPYQFCPYFPEIIKIFYIHLDLFNWVEFHLKTDVLNESVILDQLIISAYIRLEISRILYAFTAEDESNRFETYSLKLNCVVLYAHLIRDITNLINESVLRLNRHVQDIISNKR